MLKFVQLIIPSNAMNDGARIHCPNCAESIDVSEVLYHQLQTELKLKYEQQYADQKKELQSSKQKLEQQKASFEQQLKEQVEKSVKHEQQLMEQQLKKKFQQESQLRINNLEKELAEKSDVVKEFHQLKAEYERQKRTHLELKDKLEAELEHKLSQAVSVERERLRKQEADKAQLKLAEKDQVIEQLRQQAAEAQRKAEQGSMQIQGEVQELAIENWLRKNFPLDTIEEIKKGARGADCIQIVNTHNRDNVGSIYYESKRTKAFQPGWIEKLKLDMQQRQINVGVLVTETLPKEIDRIGQLEGIWICRFNDLEGLVSVLRESLIQISRALITQQNKGDKMNLLYDYLTGPEFRMQIESMVDGFVQMKDDLEREKRSIQGLWKKREKQIDKVLVNANQFYSSIRGIAGNAVPKVTQFELPEDDI